MRVAIAIKDSNIAEHFGHCDYFKVFNIEKNKVINEEKIKNPPHQKGLLPKFLSDNDINVLITGNIGEMAVKLMEELGIEAIRGVNGDINQIIEDYLNGKLKSSEDCCTDHNH